MTDSQQVMSPGAAETAAPQVSTRPRRSTRASLLLPTSSTGAAEANAISRGRPRVSTAAQHVPEPTLVATAMNTKGPVGIRESLALPKLASSDSFPCYLDWKPEFKMFLQAQGLNLYMTKQATGSSSASSGSMPQQTRKTGMQRSTRVTNNDARMAEPLA